MARRFQLRIAIRAAFMFAAVYALLLNGLFSAATAFAPSPLTDSAICAHDNEGSTQPFPSTPLAHEGLCCIAVCGMALVAVPPSDYSQILLSSHRVLMAAEWHTVVIAASPPPTFQASPRGPPTIL